MSFLPTSVTALIGCSYSHMYQFLWCEIKLLSFSSPIRNIFFMSSGHLYRTVYDLLPASEVLGSFKDLYLNLFNVLFLMSHIPPLFFIFFRWLLCFSFLLSLMFLNFHTKFPTKYMCFILNLGCNFILSMRFFNFLLFLTMYLWYLFKVLLIFYYISLVMNFFTFVYLKVIFLSFLSDQPFQVFLNFPIFELYE